MRLGLIILAGALAALASQSLAAEDELTGTLKKMRDSRSVTLGVRENSIPFSFANPGGRPVGYSVDLCQEVIAQATTEVGVEAIEVKYKTVTPANRISMLQSGEIDLECGATTNNRQRQREVAFSPVILRRRHQALGEAGLADRKLPAAQGQIGRRRRGDDQRGGIANPQ